MKTKFVLAIAALAATVAAMSLVGASSADPTSSADPGSSVATPVVGLGDAVAAIQRPATNSDRLPADAARDLTAGAGGREHVDVSRSRMVGTTANGSKVFLVPPGVGGKQVCDVLVTSSYRSTGCGPAAELTDRKQLPSASVDATGDGGWLVWAVLADGASNATVLLGDGTTQSARIDGNVVSATVSGTPTALRWRASGGAARSVALMVPASHGASG